MVAFAHSAVGIIVGVSAYQTFGQENPALGVLIAGLVGWLLHYVFDFIPHGHFFKGESNFKKYIIWVLIFDLALPIAFFLGLAAYLGKSPLEIIYILFGVGGTQLPDVLAGLRNVKLLPKSKALTTEFKFHMSTHWHGQDKKALIFGAWDIWQVGIFIIATYILIK